MEQQCKTCNETFLINNRGRKKVYCDVCSQKRILERQKAYYKRSHAKTQEKKHFTPL